MTARSFSMPTTVPLTTEPSCRCHWVNDSSSIIAKSSRDGAAKLVAVAMNSPGCAGCGMDAVSDAQPECPEGQSPDDCVLKTFGNRRRGRPGTITERTKRWFLFGRPSDKRAEQAHPPRRKHD